MNGWVKTNMVGIGRNRTGIFISTYFSRNVIPLTMFPEPYQIIFYNFLSNVSLVSLAFFLSLLLFKLVMCPLIVYKLPSYSFYFFPKVVLACFFFNYFFSIVSSYPYYVSFVLKEICKTS